MSDEFVQDVFHDLQYCFDKSNPPYKAITHTLHVWKCLHWGGLGVNVGIYSIHGAFGARRRESCRYSPRS